MDEDSQGHDTQAIDGASQADDPDGSNPSNGPRDLDFWGTLLLTIQHASQSWGYRSAEFAYPLYMVELFTNTLLPASIYGFVTTAAAIVFSNAVGRSIDRYSQTKLRTLRAYILAQKLLVGASYALFLVLFLDDRLKRAAENGGRGPDRTQRDSDASRSVWAVFASVTLLGCGVILSNVGVSVGVEREWVQIISRGSPARLTRLNAIMRRIDLLSKLLSPLFVSLLTTAISYRHSVVILLAICGLSAVFEILFIGTVYRRFPALAEDEAKVLERRRSLLQNEQQQQQQKARKGPVGSQDKLKRLGHVPGKLLAGFQAGIVEQYRDWKLFAHMPIFVTSVCISLLYMSVLSFDSTFIAYLKSETTYSDAFIAGMRAVGVVAGLLGTIVMPWMERKIGLVRAGAYSRWMERIPLIPAVVALFITGASPPFLGAGRRYRPEWNTAMLFTGLSLSRIGLWSFDLAQLAMIQTALSAERLGAGDAERKNALMALQFSLQNVFDLGHYGLTLGWNRPEQFKYAAAVSVGAVASATLLYLVGYARRVRGHLVHLDGLDALLRRKEQ